MVATGATLVLPSLSPLQPTRSPVERIQYLQRNGTTLSVLDKLDGGAGTDTLNITDTAGALPSVLPLLLLQESKTL